MPSNKASTNNLPFVLLPVLLPILSYHISESALKEAERNLIFPFDLLHITYRSQKDVVSAHEKYLSPS